MVDARYREIFKTLKVEILSGKYASPSVFPSSLALARRFKTSRATVRRALEILRVQGLVQGRRGSGTFLSRVATERKIGLVIPSVVLSEFFRHVVSCLERLAKDAGYSLVFYEAFSSNPARRLHEARELVADLVRKHVTGVIFQPLEADDDTNRRILKVLDAKKIPVVLLDRDIVLPPNRTAHDLVAINNFNAAERMVTHLVEVGARHVAFLTEIPNVSNVADRERGFMAAQLRLKGKRAKFSVVHAAASDRATVARLVKGKQRVDAFLCDSDTTAFCLRQTLDKLGISVPQQVMLAGFDDVRLASVMVPPLTTVHQPTEDIARQAFRRLLERIAKPSLAPTEILVQAPLVVRQSTQRKAEVQNQRKRR